MARRLREDRGVGRPAAPPGGAAAPVEDRQLDLPLGGERGEALLRPEDLPLRGEVAAVLPRVRVADHDLEPAAALLDEAGEMGLVQQGLDDRGRLAEVADRLEERNRRDAGARLGGQVDEMDNVLGRPRPGDDHRVDRSVAVLLLRGGDGMERASHSRRGIAKLGRMEAGVELGDVEAEELDPPAKTGQTPVRDPAAPVRAQAAVDDVEIGLQLLDPSVALVAEPPPDEAQLAAVGLVAVLLADLLRVGGQRRARRGRSTPGAPRRRRRASASAPEPPPARGHRRGSARAPARGPARAPPGSSPGRRADSRPCRHRSTSRTRAGAERPGPSLCRRRPAPRRRRAGCARRTRARGGSRRRPEVAADVPRPSARGR